MPYSYNADSIAAIRRPDGTYADAVEPLGLPGVARQLTAGSSSHRQGCRCSGTGGDQQTGID